MQLTPNQGFGFAKLCARVRKQCFPTLVLIVVRCRAALSAPSVIGLLRSCCYVHFFAFVTR